MCDTADGGAAGATAIVCILCPRGCELLVSPSPSGAPLVSGNACPRGEGYGRSELVDPRRSLTTTVKTIYPDRPRLSVKSSGLLPKARLLEAVRSLDRLTVARRVRRGEIVAADILGLGVDIVATDDLD